MLCLGACFSSGMLVGRPLAQPLRFVARGTMSNSQNPNNKEYWRSRGFQDRPTNWKDQARRINQIGQATAAANAAAAKTPEEKRHIGHLKRRINHSVKHVLGRQAEIHDAGSMKKHTDIHSSDLDIWIKMPNGKQMTPADMTELAEDLRFDPGKHIDEVIEKPLSIQLLSSRGLKVDLVPGNSTFRDPKKLPTPKPSNKGFHCNPKAQEAVRLVKMETKQKYKGRHIEDAVLQAQRKTKGQSNVELRDRALKILSAANGRA